MFEVKGFFKNQDVSLRFDKVENIFVGENGLGKTTILNLLFYTISLDFKRLLNYEFDEINVEFKDNSKFSISVEDIKNFSRRKNRHLYKYDNYEIDREQYELEIELQQLELNIERLEVEFNNGSHSKRGYNQKRSAVSKKMITSKKNMESFIEKMTIMTENLDILYFPTFRRIEEDLLNLEIDDSIDDRAKYKNNKRRNLISQGRGKQLIRFGMSDVEQTINTLLEKIKQLSITSFNQMTGVLLQQYVDKEIYIAEEDIDFSKMEVILGRIGDKIDSKLNYKILTLIESKEIFHKENDYLRNFLGNLINSYKEQEELDIRIKKFVDICNQYLVNKQYIYDESTVALKIINKKSGVELPLQGLSSGEKQVISTFSKIYLEEHKEFIILFDEPELSLSIPWQERYLPDIVKSEKCNLLIAVTHSPFIFENDILFERASLISEHILYKNDDEEN